MLSNFGRRGWRSGRKGAQNAPGLVRAATPADEMDKTVNVSVMEGLNTGVRGNKHLPRNRNRHCDSEHNNGVRLGTPAGAVGRSFGEALCIQLFGTRDGVGSEVRRPEWGMYRAYALYGWRRRTSLANANVQEQAIAQRISGQFLKRCRATTALVVEFESCCPRRVVVVSSFLFARFPICLSNISARERRERVTKCARPGELRGPLSGPINGR